MEQLKKTLQNLHQQLASADEVDPELKQLLEVLDKDIHGVLKKSDVASAEDRGLAARADSMAARFRAKHPQMEPVLREIADALARLGI